MSSLRIAGEVDAPTELSSKDFSALAEQVPDVSEFVSGREGTAVRFASLIAAARPRATAQFVTLESSDGAFAASVPLADLDDALVVYALHDEVLPAEHGGPFRFLIPDAAACRSGGADRCATVKALGSITLTAEPGRDTRKVH